MSDTPNAAPDRRWLTVASAAKHSDLSDKSIRRMINSGRLTAHKPNGRILIDKRQLDAVISGAADRRAG